METENWRTISDRFLSKEANEDFARTYAQLPGQIDHAAYAAQWSDLTARISKALPLAPTAPEAIAFYKEWQALLEPFTAVATPEMMRGVGKMYDNIDAWKGEQTPPFSAEVWTFIKAVGAHLKG